jgi:heat shock protein HslJ
MKNTIMKIIILLIGLFLIISTVDYIRPRLINFDNKPIKTKDIPVIKVIPDIKNTPYPLEEEVDQSKMDLNMKTWTWFSDESIDKFTITFKNDGTFSATTDCNGIGGEYLLNGNKINLDKMMSTLMYCEGSQEADFSRMLGDIESYSFGSKGELIFKFKNNIGEMIFK